MSEKQESVVFHDFSGDFGACIHCGCTRNFIDKMKHKLKNPWCERAVPSDFSLYEVPANPDAKVMIVRQAKEEAGTKFDGEKVPLHLLPTEALWEVGKVLRHGQKKYNAWNWKKGMSWSRLAGAAERHLFAWIEGKSADEESGLSHLAHCACCVLFLLTYEKLGLGTDDRWKPGE